MGFAATLFVANQVKRKPFFGWGEGGRDFEKLPNTGPVFCPGKFLKLRKRATNAETPPMLVVPVGGGLPHVSALAVFVLRQTKYETPEHVCFCLMYPRCGCHGFKPTNSFRWAGVHITHHLRRVPLASLNGPRLNPFGQIWHIYIYICMSMQYLHIYMYIHIYIYICV